MAVTRPIEIPAAKKRGPGRPKGSVTKKRGPGRPPKADAAAEAPVKRGPGRPKGSGVKKRGPGRPKGSGVKKRGPGRPKGSGRKAAVAKGLGPRQVKRLIKAALKAQQAKLPKQIKRELRRLLR
jgi:hypothetical protein